MQWFRIIDNKIVESGLNGNDAVPVVEYPNNSRRLSDIEITIAISDSINTLSSDRINGIEQFVSAWIKFVNCEIDSKTFAEMRMQGALVVKSNNGDSNKADVDVMTNELNQTEGQVVFDDLFERFLSIQGLANRSNNNSGGDTGNAVNLRNGHFDAGLRTAINEPILKKSERMSLKIILNRLRIRRSFNLMPSDIEIHINHNKLDNLLTKAEALEILIRCGIDPAIAVKIIDLFGDPEYVSMQSIEMMKRIQEKYAAQEQQNSNQTNREAAE